MESLLEFPFIPLPNSILFFSLQKKIIPLNFTIQFMSLYFCHMFACLKNVFFRFAWLCLSYKYNHGLCVLLWLAYFILCCVCVIFIHVGVVPSSSLLVSICILFIHSAADRLSGCFEFRAIVNNPALLVLKLVPAAHVHELIYTLGWNYWHCSVCISLYLLAMKS